MKKYQIESSRNEPYRVRPISEQVDWSAISPSLDCFTVYDEEAGDDAQVFPASDSKIEFGVFQDDDGTVAILIGGVVTLEDADAERIDRATCGVDYALDIESGQGDELEADEDYEFIENYNILLTAIDD